MPSLITGIDQNGSYQTTSSPTGGQCSLNYQVKNLVGKAHYTTDCFKTIEEIVPSMFGGQIILPMDSITHIWTDANSSLELHFTDGGTDVYSMVLLSSNEELAFHEVVDDMGVSIAPEGTLLGDPATPDCWICNWWGLGGVKTKPGQTCPRP